MEAPFLIQWFPEPIVNALCWTLLHSLWIGLLTAGLAGGVIIGTQKASTRLRYQLLCGTLLVFAGSTGFIFYRELTARQPGQPVNHLPVISTSFPTIQPFSSPVILNDSSLVHRLTAFIDQESGWIFGIWLVFFVLRSLKLMSGLYYVHRIRYRQVYAVDEDWKRKLASFSRALGIQQSISLLQSELVKVPVTVGLIRPVILLPISLVFQLPPEQIETILWHELAHIQRQDYLVNLLQSLLETVFFFNPGLLWLSSLIREEREVCCDDIVLAHTCGKSHYVDALLAFQNIRPQEDSAMALGLGSHQLVNRLKRIVTQENKRLSLMEKLALLTSLVLLSAFAVMPPSQAKLSQPTTTSLKKNAIVILKEPSPSVVQRSPGVSPPQTRLPDIVSKADTVPVFKTKPTSSATVISAFTSILFVNNNQDMANREMLVRDTSNNQYRLKIVNNTLIALDINNTHIPASDLSQYQHLLRQIDQVLVEKQRLKQETITATTAQAEAQRQQQLQHLKEAQQTKLTNNQQARKTGNPVKQWPDKVAQQKAIPAEISKTEASTPGFQKPYRTPTQADMVAKKHSWRQKKIPDLPDIAYDQQRVRGVIAALVQDKIVANQSAVDWFGLSESELIVNGIRQSNELHQKLKTQYGIKAQYGLYYGPVQMVGTGVFLEKTDL